MRIIHIADLHLDGKNFSKSSSAIEEVINNENSDSVLVLSGDIFSSHNIADRYRTVGELQSLLLRLIMHFDKCIVLVGNHDKKGQQQSALSILEGFEHVDLIEYPKVVDFEMDNEKISLALIPWIDKGTFYAKKCIGIGKSESQAMFIQSIHDMLTYVKNRFDEKINSKKLLFGHMEIAGTKINDGYSLESTGFTFNETYVTSLGADFVSLGHIHKRAGLYCGALYQQNFGEEGNPQGYEIISVSQESITVGYQELKTIKEYKTININTLAEVENMGDFNLDLFDYKFRIYSEEAYNAIAPEILANVVVEKLYGKKEHISRIDQSSVSLEMTNKELLELYIKDNTIPEGIEKKEMMEALI